MPPKANSGSLVVALEREPVPASWPALVGLAECGRGHEAATLLVGLVVAGVGHAFGCVAVAQQNEAPAPQHQLALTDRLWGGFNFPPYVSRAAFGPTIWMTQKVAC